MDTNTSTSVAAAVGSIWASVSAISLFAPDMVSGSEQQHLPVAAFTAWIWGLLATGAVVKLWVRGRRPDLLQVLSFAVAAVWIAVAAIAVFSPEMVTGTDPTRIPLAAIISPIVAVVVTCTGAGLVASVPVEER